MRFTQTKQPGEVVPSVMDFLKRLPTGETITDAEVTIIDDDGVDTSYEMLLGDPLIAGGTQIAVKIAGGDDGVTYKVTFTATTSPGAYVLEEDVELQVAEI